MLLIADSLAFAIGYIALPLLSLYGIRRGNPLLMIGGLAGWGFWNFYTFLTIHTAQTYYPLWHK